MELDLSTDAAPGPERTILLAETLASVVRCLNHDTRHHEALRYPSEADRVVRELSAMAGRLPQLLGQVASWLNTEYEEGRIGMAREEPGYAVLSATSRLEAAGEYADLLRAALDRAASLTSGMMGVRDDAG